MSTALLTPRILAGYPGLVLVTHEEIRAIDLLKATATELQRPLYAWNCTQGLNTLLEIPDQTVLTGTEEDPIPVLERVGSLPPSILLMQDMHLYLDQPLPALYRRLKTALLAAKQQGVTIVLLMPVLRLPVDLEKCFSVIDFDLPDRATLARVLDHLCHDPQPDGTLLRVRETPGGETLEALLDAAAGLTSSEAEDAFALSIALHGDFVPETVLREKAATVRKNGLVEYIEPTLTLADVGGWDAYKAHVHTSRHIFSKAARAYGLVPFAGDLLVGQGGTGKSLTAGIVGSVLNLPIIRVRAENLKGSLVGQTEGNWRSVIQTCLSLNHCLLFMDEIDGLMSGHQSSGRSDGGTTASLIKAILQDVEQHKGRIYFIFTANDIDQIPDPLIDRLNVWSVELPNDTERGEIFQIHMRRTGRESAKVCPKGLMQIVKHTDGFSGRQIERVWVKALNLAFNDGQREPLERDILEALKGEVPTSQTMKAAIEARRARLANIAKPVTSPTLKTVLTGNGRKMQAAG